MADHHEKSERKTWRPGPSDLFAIAVILAIAVGCWKGDISKPNYLLIAIAILFLISIALLLTTLLEIKETRTLRGTLKSLLNTAGLELDLDKMGLIALSDVLQKEIELAKESEVWVVSSTLAPDLNGPFGEVVKNNICDKLVKYHFIIPEGVVNTRYREFKRKLDLKKKKQQACLIDHPITIQCDLIFGTTGIYHPHSKHRWAVMFDAMGEVPYALKLSSDQVLHLYEQVKPVVEKDAAKKLGGKP